MAVATVALAGGLAVIVWHVDPAWSIGAALLLSVLNGHWGTLGFPGFFSPDRLLLVLAIVTVVARGPGAADRRAFEWRPIHVLLAATVAFAACSAAWAGTLVDNPGSFRLLDRLGIMPFAVFAVSPLVFDTPERRRILLGCLVVLGAYLGLTALFETTGPSALVLPGYISDPSLPVHFGRARGPFVQAAVNGLALYACATACAVAWTAARGWRRTACAAIGLLCAVSLIFTLQRQVWLGGSLAALLTLVAVAPLRRWLLPAAALAAAAVALTLAFVPGFSEKATKRAGQGETVAQREQLNRAALNLWERRPLTGWGYTTFERVSAEHYSLPSDSGLMIKQRMPVHNVAASNLAELGLIGTSLWVACVAVGIVGTLLRRGPPEALAWRILLGSTFVLWLVIAIASPLTDVFPNLLLWLLAGVVYGMTEPGRRAPRRAPRPLTGRGREVQRGLDRRAVDLVAHPELEHQQRPDALRVVLHAGGVAVEHAADGVRAEVAAVAGHGVEQHVAREVAQLAAEPVGQRQPEAALRRVEDLVGDPAAQRAAQHDLLLACRAPSARREATRRTP